MLHYFTAIGLEYKSAIFTDLLCIVLFYKYCKIEIFNIKLDVAQSKKLFDFKEDKIFKRSYVLGGGYVPEILDEGNEGINAESEIFYPFLRKGKSDHAFIYSPTGSGKTVVINTFFRHLYSEASYSINLGLVSILCKKYGTTTKILRLLIKELVYQKSYLKVESCTDFFIIHFSLF